MPAHLWLVTTTPAQVYIAASTIAKAQELFAVMTAPKIVAAPLSPPVAVIGSTRYLSASDVCKTLHVSRSTLYRWIELEQFPKPMQIGPRSVRWPVSDLATYQRRAA